MKTKDTFSFLLLLNTNSCLIMCHDQYGEGNGTPLQYSCLENPVDRGAWQAAVYEVTKSQTRLSYFTFTFHFHALEKEMATHSSILAWRIPGTGEPVGCCLWGRTESDTTEATYSTVQLYVSERCSVSSLRVMLAVGRR